MGLFDREENMADLVKALREEHKKLIAANDELIAVNKKKDDEIRDLKWKMSTMEKEYELSTEKKINELRKSMQESLIKSDLVRTEAVAKLEIYEKTDSKADANAIKDMIGKLIEKIGSQTVNVVK
jgi:hypothetical protein